MRLDNTGSKRCVLLVGRYAIKIARFNIWRLLQRIARLLIPGWKEARMRTYAAEYSANRKEAFALYLFGPAVWRGMLVNKREQALYQEHPEFPLAPVHRCYLEGVVLIMERGEPVPEAVSRELRAHYTGADLTRPYHVCRFKSGLLFVDYGHPKAPAQFGL